MADAFLMRRFATFARDLLSLLRVHGGKAARWFLRHRAPPFNSVRFGRIADFD
jgi:hypothetical protein